ncbi:hypothetical protein BDZ89DRAFT_49063 [Hymenopellis radicata]|nr:hypothetical protein BDZ89DRAFT_49063 [Hymenopellis radicata]
MSSPLPKRSEYIVIQLDPVASLERLDDPVATETCRALKPNKYLACVVQRLPAIVGIPVQLFLCLASVRGMVPGPDKFLIPEMCLPLSPSTHPWDRLQLTSEPSLPWPGLDCFLMTLASVNVLTEYSVEDSRLHGKYTQPDVADLGCSITFDKDWRTRLDLGGVDLASGDPNAAMHLRTTTMLELSTAVPRKSPTQSKSLVSSSSIASDSDDSDLAPSVKTASVEDKVFEDPRRRMPFVHCWVDLETIPMEEIGNPWDFKKEIEVLNRLEEESKIRMQEKIKTVANMDAELDVVVKRTRSLLSLTKKSDSGSNHSNNGVSLTVLCAFSLLMTDSCFSSNQRCAVTRKRRSLGRCSCTARCR